MAYAEYGSPLPAPALNSEHPLGALFKAVEATSSERGITVIGEGSLRTGSCVLREV